MNLRALPVLAVALAIVLATGCPGPTRLARPYSAPAANELLASLTARQAAIRGISMEARATSWLGGERVRGTVQMLAMRDGRLRFEAEVSLQGTVAALAVDAGGFTYLDHQKHEFKKGPACPSNVASLLRIPLKPTEVAAMLLGDAPAPTDPTLASIEWDDLRGVDLLVYPGPGESTLWLGFRRGDPRKPAWDLVFLEGMEKGADNRWRVAYDEPKDVDGVPLPQRIRFAEPGKSFDDGVEIKVRDRSLNPEPADGAFVLDAPAGYKVIATGCGTP